MKTLWRMWDRFFFARFDPYSLALLRIGTGLLWLCLLLFMAPNWDRFFGADGLSCATDPALAGRMDWWSVFAWTDGVINVWFWWAFGIITAILFTLGLATRWMTIACWVMIGSMMHRDLMLTNGEDFVLHVVLWWCIFAPLGRELSVDAWLHRRKLARRGIADDRPLPMIWATRMLQLTVVGIYAFSLPRKLAGDYVWLNGDAFFFAIVNDHWSKWPWKELFFHHWLSALATYGAIAGEGLFPILVWFRRTRLPVLIAMAFFHLMIALMLDNVAFFSLSMVTSYAVFLPPQTSRRLVGWISQRAVQFVDRARGLSTPLADAVDLRP